MLAVPSLVGPFNFETLEFLGLSLDHITTQRHNYASIFRVEIPGAIFATQPGHTESVKKLQEIWSRTREKSSPRTWTKTASRNCCHHYSDFKP